MAKVENRAEKQIAKIDKLYNDLAKEISLAKAEWDKAIQDLSPEQEEFFNTYKKLNRTRIELGTFIKQLKATLNQTYYNRNFSKGIEVEN